MLRITYEYGFFNLWFGSKLFISSKSLRYIEAMAKVLK